MGSWHLRRGFACRLRSMGHDHHFNIGGILVPAQKTPDFDKSPKIQAVKSPRTYIRDSGIVQIPNYEALLGHPILGKSWEGFVVETIINALPWDIQPSFYRTSAGAEIDLVLEFGLFEYWAIEIKASCTPNLTKGFHMACEDFGEKRKFVVYTGEVIFPSSNEATILSLVHFIDELRKQTR